MQFKRVVVTGLGAITPLGNDVQTYWENLLKGVSGACPITKFNAEKFRTKFACEVKDFSPELYIDKKEIKRIDLFTQYALAASTQAVEDAGFNLDTLDKDRTGVIFGSGIGGLK